MWHEMRADTHLYCRIRFGDPHPGFLRRLRARLTSRGLFALAVHRLARYCATERARRNWGRWLLGRVVLGVAVPMAVWLARSNVLASCTTEGGIWLSDGGHFVIGARRIGAGTIIHDHVTIGMDVRQGEIKTPTIGREVWIGSNCVIFGDITIGDGATVMPNTILSKHVPDRAVAQGNPGRIVKRDYDNRRLRSTGVVVRMIAEAEDRAGSTEG